MDTLDFEKLAKTVNPDTTRLPYQQVKQHFTKVAFDVFQLNNTPFESYWILEQGEDGQEYLVAKYDDAPDGELEAHGSWQALSDKTASNVTVYYKGVPVKRCTASDFGFTTDDVHLFTKTVADGLNGNDELAEKMLAELPAEKADALAQQFPELKKK